MLCVAQKPDKGTKKKWISRFLSFCLALYLAGLIFFIVAGTKEELTRSDVAVVLGNEVLADGTPSPRLQARLDRAIDIYRRGLCTKIIVSGGTGQEGFDEAVSMRSYLLQHAVLADDIVADSNGVNTRATATFTAQYMADNQYTSAIAVTQYFHVPRTKLALRQAKIPIVTGAYARYVEWRDIHSLQREVPAYLAYFFHIK